MAIGGVLTKYAGSIEVGVWGGFALNDIVAEFAIGIVLNTIYHKFKFSGFLYFKVILVSSCIAVFGFIKFHYGYEVGLRVIDLGVPSFFVCLSFLMCESLIRKNPVRLFVSLGNSSYSLYLIHVFAISGVSVIFSHLKITESSIFFVGSLIIVSLLAGEICFRIIEKPLLAISNRYR